MLSREEVLHIADLARIHLDEQEIEIYQKDLSSILEYFKELEELDTSQVEPIGHITGMQNITREDKANPTNEEFQKDCLHNVPDTKDGYIEVKSVF